MRAAGHFLPVGPRSDLEHRPSPRCTCEPIQAQSLDEPGLFAYVHRPQVPARLDPAPIPPEVDAFADDIRYALAHDSAALSLRELPADPPGTEPGVTLLLDGLPLFHFRRDEFLEAMYDAGCDVLEDLQRQGRPLSVATATGPVR
jgi:hypothetical protein